MPVGTAATDNDIYSTIVGLGSTTLGEATPRTFIQRHPDARNIIDTVYRARYVIPAGSGITSARPPVDGYILEEFLDLKNGLNLLWACFNNFVWVSTFNSKFQSNFKIKIYII